MSRGSWSSHKESRKAVEEIDEERSLALRIDLEREYNDRG